MNEYKNLKLQIEQNGETANWDLQDYVVLGSPLKDFVISLKIYKKRKMIGEREWVYKTEEEALKNFKKLIHETLRAKLANYKYDQNVNMAKSSGSIEDNLG